MRLLLKFGSATAGLVLFASIALGHGGATGIVKQRMDAMKDIGAQMKLIGQMIKGQKPYNGKEVANAGLVIADLSGEDMLKLFPENSLDHTTEATSEIWSNWQVFEKYSTDLRKAAESIADKAGKGAEKVVVAEAFGRLAKVCKGCHEEFRVKK